MIAQRYGIHCSSELTHLGCIDATNAWSGGVTGFQAELARHGFKHSAATVDSMEAQLILVLSGAYIGYSSAPARRRSVDKGDFWCRSCCLRRSAIRRRF